MKAYHELVYLDNNTAEPKVNEFIENCWCVYWNLLKNDVLYEY